MKAVEKVTDTKGDQITIDRIRQFEKELKNFPQTECPLVHRFLDGMYAREITMKKGTLLTSKMHKKENLTIISKGKVIEVTEDEHIREIEAPFTMISPAGVKRVLYILEDTIWTTVHKNVENIEDLGKLEDMIIQKEPEMLEKEESKCLG